MAQADRVHSTPPLNWSSNNVIKFPCAVSPLPKILSEQDLREIDRKVRASLTLETPETPREKRQRERREAPPLSETHKNQRLRQQRREVWREAEAATHWARALMDFDDACSWAQSRGIAEELCI